MYCNRKDTPQCFIHRFVMTDMSKEIKILIAIIILCFCSCATKLIGIRQEPLYDETVERKVEMVVTGSPTISLAAGEDITAYTKIEPHFVVKIQEHLRKRHYYNEIITNERYLHPIAKYSLIVAGLVGTFYGFYHVIYWPRNHPADTFGILIGGIAAGAGLSSLGAVNVLSKPKEVLEIGKKYHDDVNFTTLPIGNQLINVSLKERLYSFDLCGDSSGIVIIPADSIIKLCPEKDEIEITVKLTDEPSLSKQLIITSAFINSCKKIEELKKLEQIRLAKFEKERKKIEAEIVKIINKVWKNKDEVSSATSISYSSDGTVNIRFTQSKSERTACIKAGKMWGVSGAIKLFETSAWSQFIVIAPALFKKSDVSTVKLTMDVAFSAIINPSHEYTVSAVDIVMSRATARNVKWGSDIMRKDPEDVADTFSTDEMFRIFLLDGFERGAFYDTWE